MCYDILSKSDSMARDVQIPFSWIMLFVMLYVICLSWKVQGGMICSLHFWLTHAYNISVQKKHAWQVLVTDKGTASFKMQQSNLRENVMLYTCTESMAHKITDLKSLSLFSSLPPPPPPPRLKIAPCDTDVCVLSVLQAVDHCVKYYNLKKEA